MKLLYYSQASYGGIADYAHEQANAITQHGVDVIFLCPHNYPRGRGEQYKLLPILADLKPQKPIANKLIKGIHYIQVTLSNFKKVNKLIRQHRIQFVLFGSYTEYLAPLWAAQFRLLAKQGVVFGAVVHDPVRSFTLGPPWWHRWSVREGYSFLKEAFVHTKIQLDTGKSVPLLRTTVIPMGSYSFPEPSISSEVIRSQLDIPSDAKVMLSFGHIREGKNLDLILRAMVDLTEVYLIVAGQDKSSTQELVFHYQELAQRLGVSGRCHWQIRFISYEEAGNFFNCSDLILLTYSKNFHSASATLSTAIHYQKLCLASSGEGTLKTSVQKYNLGLWIQPDNINAIKEGIHRIFAEPPEPKWDRYLQDNSWSSNAKLVLNAFSTAK